MASPEFLARLRYLNDSAHLLAKTAPGTSKYLMSRCNTLMLDNNLERSESQRCKTCFACGTIMILGWVGTLEVESHRARRGKSPPDKKPAHEARAIVVECESCGRKTRHRLNISPPAKEYKFILNSIPLSTTNQYSIGSPTSNDSPVILSGLSNSLPEAKSNTSPTPSASSSSKKRAKARKQGGLGAILARQRASDSRGSGFNLDLLDFMKKA